MVDLIIGTEKCKKAHENKDILIPEKKIRKMQYHILQG
jgi:hypothetical protein